MDVYECNHTFLSAVLIRKTRTKAFAILFVRDEKGNQFSLMNNQLWMNPLKFLSRILCTLRDQGCAVLKETNAEKRNSMTYSELIEDFTIGILHPLLFVASALSC